MNAPGWRRGAADVARILRAPRIMRVPPILVDSLQHFTCGLGDGNEIHVEHCEPRDLVERKRMKHEFKQKHRSTEAQGPLRHVVFMFSS